MIKIIVFVAITTQVLGRAVDDPIDESSGNQNEKRVIMPGTLWCGIGNIANSDDQLGTYADVDSCCRDHDKCDRKVAAFAKNYGYRNWRPYTVSDCKCDTKFFSCLKNAKTHTKVAMMVGELFFNILHMPCLKFNSQGTHATKGASPTYK